MDWPEWEQKIRTYLQEVMAVDAAHDLAHVHRVVANARQLAKEEQGALEIVLPAAWLHDCLVVAKDSPQRSQASRLAAAQAGRFLAGAGYPAHHIEAVEHAIAAHSFSAGIRPQTAEARVVQDADRLDALGAVGIARCFTTGGQLGRPLYHPDDPFCGRRQPDDRLSSLDHFYTKLLRLPGTMQTTAGRREALRRLAFMEQYLAQLAAEIQIQPAS